MVRSSPLDFVQINLLLFDLRASTGFPILPLGTDDASRDILHVLRVLGRVPDATADRCRLHVRDQRRDRLEDTKAHGATIYIVSEWHLWMK